MRARAATAQSLQRARARYTSLPYLLTARAVPLRTHARTDSGNILSPRQTTRALPRAYEGTDIRVGVAYLAPGCAQRPLYWPARSFPLFGCICICGRGDMARAGSLVDRSTFSPRGAAQRGRLRVGRPARDESSEWLGPCRAMLCARSRSPFSLCVLHVRVKALLRAGGGLCVILGHNFLETGVVG